MYGGNIRGIRMAITGEVESHPGTPRASTDMTAVHFPMAGASATRYYSAQKPRDGMARILVVEEMPLRKLFARVLVNDGHDVTAVGTAVQTLRALREQTFDLLIIDLNLPGTPGETFARGLHRRFPAMKHRLLSGLSATDTLWAPFDVHELQQRANIISVTLPPAARAPL